MQFAHGEGPCPETIATDNLASTGLRRANRPGQATGPGVTGEQPGWQSRPSGAWSMLRVRPHPRARAEQAQFPAIPDRADRPALNLCATRPAAFTDRSTATVSFAGYASTALIGADVAGNGQLSPPPSRTSSCEVTGSVGPVGHRVGPTGPRQPLTRDERPAWPPNTPSTHP